MDRLGLGWEKGHQSGFFVPPFIIQGFGTASLKWLRVSMEWRN